MKRKQLSKWTAGLMAASMLVTGGSWTASTAHAAAKEFSDVVADHWAHKHLSKLTMQEILSGYPDGTFKPNHSISHQEAIIIAVRFMGLEDELTTTGVVVTPDDLKINDSFKKYINLAIKKQLIHVDEEVAIVNENPGMEWGKSPASREWVTRLLIRAIGMESQARQAAAETTKFNDDHLINSPYRGYIHVAASTGLVKGVTETEFSPTTPVTRAAISTLFSLAQAEVAFSGQVSGILLGITPTKLTLLHNGSNIIRSYSLSEDSLIYRYDSNSVADIDDLKLYGEVLLISKGDQSIGYIEQTDDTPQVEHYTGTLTYHASTLNRLTLLIGNSDHDFTYDLAHPPIITDLNGNALKVEELPTNVQVKLTVDKVRTSKNIVAVQVMQSVLNKSGVGQITAWDLSNGVLQVSDPEQPDARESYTLSANAVIKNSAGANLTWDQLKVNDLITYVVKTGVIDSITVTKSEVPPITGIMQGIIKANNSIQYTVNNSLESDFLAANVKVKIEGMLSASIEDIYMGDSVTLTLNDKGEVSEIVITDRTVKTMAGATILDYSTSAKTLIVNDLNGKKFNLDITDATKFELNGTPFTLDNATIYLTSKGKRINVTYTGNQAVSISLAAKINGTVTEKNVTNQSIKIMIDATNSMTFTTSTAYVELHGKASTSFADLAIGEKVTIIQNGLAGQLSTLQVHKNVQYEVISTTPASNKLKVKRLDGVTEELTLSSTLALHNENGAAITLGSFGAGSLINISYQGISPVLVKKVPAGTYGVVSAVHTATASIDLVNSSNTTVTKALGANPIIVRNNTVLSSLAAIQPQDRVEIRQNENDQTIVEIITPVRKTIQTMNSSTGTLVVKRATLTEENTYLIDSSVYIHQGSTVLTSASLLSGDSINLYFVRGKLLEINKL